MPSCVTCQVDCRGKQCRSCYDNARNQKDPTNGLDTTLDLNASHLVVDPQFGNAAFPPPVIVEPEAPPTSLEEMYNMFVHMKSYFTHVVKEKDVMIAALSKRVTSLEETAKKTAKSTLPNQNTPDSSQVITEMKKEYTENMKTIKATVAAQQKTLEDLQHDKRVKNLVITGVPEPEGLPLDARKEDQATIETIFTTVECPGVCASRVTRLGRKRDPPADAEEGPPPPRPLLVTLNSVVDVRAVMNGRLNLKNHRTFGRVYIKRDQHPLIRKEWNRLREFAKREKNAPINVGCTIKVDYEKKAVTRDGESILAFVSPFRDAGPNQSE